MAKFTLNNKLTAKATFVLGPNPLIDAVRDGIVPIQSVLEEGIGTEIVLLLVDKTPFIHKLARLPPFKRKNNGIFTRTRDEEIVIGDSIFVRIIEIRDDKVRIGIECPKEMSIIRKENYEGLRRDVIAKAGSGYNIAAHHWKVRSTSPCVRPFRQTRYIGKNKCSRQYSFSSVASAALAVGLGAIGAHALKSQLTAEQLVTYHTAVQYQMYHAIGLVLVGLLGFHDRSRWFAGAGWSMLIGIILFSGLLYAWLATGRRFFVYPVPVGGVALVGWLLMAIGAVGLLGAK